MVILNIFSNWLPYSRADTATVKLNRTLLQIMGEGEEEKSSNTLKRYKYIKSFGFWYPFRAYREETQCHWKLMRVGKKRSMKSRC